MTEESSNRLYPVDIADNQFLNETTGQTWLPSLINPEDERNFKIQRDFFIKGYATLRDSVKQIRQYEIADQYNPVLANMSGEEEYWLKFIGMFKSVQKIQLMREAELFPDNLSIKTLNKSLTHLLLNGLIVKWQYHHPISDKDIAVFTLSGNGFRFLNTYYADNYFQPQNFFNLNSRFHLRFWETLDVYQLLISLPVYHESSTLFKGFPREGRPLLPSPLQVNLELMEGSPKNLIFYPALHNDDINYYKDAVSKWANYIETESKDSINLNFPINDLPVGQNVLAFYVPTLTRARELNRELQLKTFKFPSIFLIGIEVAKNGISKAFYMPRRDNDDLRMLNAENILWKRSDRYEK